MAKLTFEQVRELFHKDPQTLHWHPEEKQTYTKFHDYYQSGYYKDFIRQLPGWFVGKKIVIFKIPGTNDEIARTVQQGIWDLIQEFNLDFDVRYYNLTSSDPLQASIESFMRSSVANGTLNTQKMISLLVNHSYSQKEKYAYVIVTASRLTSMIGHALFREGIILFGLGANRNLTFIRNLAKHEALHLLGFNFAHHSVIKSYVEGRQIGLPVHYDGPCNHSQAAFTGIICPVCKQAFTYYLQGLKQASGINVFRR